MGEIKVRTDLAVENTEKLEKEAGEIAGVKLKREWKKNGAILVTGVLVETKEGAEKIGKPEGTYITIEAEGLRSPEGNIMEEVAKELGERILSMFYRMSNGKRIRSLLVAGLGNREITADALGPKVSDYLYATRHEAKEGEIGISCLAPGVMAQTGMETLEIIRGVARETRPDLIIVIDALAARSTSRFHTTIQLSDTGIAPGSGVGNHRQGLTRETVGAPVLAIGVPTVVDAATIVSDAMDRLLEELKGCEAFSGFSNVFQEFSQEEKYQLTEELLWPSIGRMHVTPKDIDETVRAFAHMISAGIELAVAAYNG